MSNTLRDMHACKLLRMLSRLYVFLEKMKIPSQKELNVKLPFL